MLISCLFLLTGCRSAISLNSPIMEKTPDIISKPTKTIVSKETVAELPKDTSLKTDSQEKVEVKLEKDTVATIIVPSTVNLPEISITPQIESEKIHTKDQIIPPKVPTLEKPVQVILPKNTSVVLPENTYLQTSDQTKVVMNAQTEVTLPIGTEISITKINWYAILFYLVLVLLLAWYYLQGKTEDKDGDGYIDDLSKQKSKKRKS